MRFLAALVVWVSGGYLLYMYGKPILEQFQARYDDPDTFQALTVIQILDLFAWPFFILGIMLWVAVPGSRSKDRKSDKQGRKAP